MVDVNQVVRETLALRAYEQRVSNITVIDALATGLPQVFADGYQIQQVLLNLVINAEQAMLSANGRGILVVRTWHDIEQESIVLEINDDGPGIPDEVQPKIFDPFFTTKEVGKGTGLGLTVAYAIVQEHGGRIRLDPVLTRARRSTWRYRSAAASCHPAPIAASDSPSRPTQSRERPCSWSKTKRPSPRPWPMPLRTPGIVVEHASDGEEALARIRTQTFDAVICDLKMPRLDGKAFYRTLSAGTPGLARRVIFVTGDVAGTDAETFLEQSGCRWLAKPFRLGELLRVLGEVLA